MQEAYFLVDAGSNSWEVDGWEVGMYGLGADNLKLYLIGWMVLMLMMMLTDGN